MYTSSQSLMVLLTLALSSVIAQGPANNSTNSTVPSTNTTAPGGGNSTTGTNTTIIVPGGSNSTNATNSTNTTRSSTTQVLSVPTFSPYPTGAITPGLNPYNGADRSVLYMGTTLLMVASGLFLLALN